MTTSDTAQLRQRLNMVFDDSELTAFCLDYFPKVYDRFSQGMRRDYKITLLLDYCRRQPTGFETLLKNVRKESGMSNSHREQLKPVIEALSEYIDSSPQCARTTKGGEGEALLDEMPTDKLPTVKSLPVGSRMLFTRYANFVGRERELRQLATILKTERGGAAIGQMAATTGLGGIGKTQLAVEFTHRYGQYFAGGVFWLDFGTPNGISNEVALCGGKKGMNLLAGFENLPLPDRVDLVKRAWKEPLPRLLIFDNCEEEELVDKWHPTTGGCRVLITSRRGAWDTARAIQQVRLDVLPPAESDALLAKFVPRLSREEKAKIADNLGYFPLALHLAGSFLNRYKRLTVDKYLEELEDKTLRHISLEGRGSTYSPTQHELHVARTFAVSWERLDKSDPIDQLAQQIFLHSAYFAPGVPIPPDLWRLTLAEQDTSPATLTEYDYEDAQYRLLELGLLEEEPTGVVIHRLLAAFAHIQPMPQPQQAVEQALLKEANRLNNAGYPAPLQAWQPHLRHLTDSARQREDEIAASLCNTMGYHLQLVADYKNARPYLERALAIFEKVLGADHFLTAHSLNNLGNLLQAMGEYESARPYYEGALAIYEKVLGAEDLHTAHSLNNLGELLRVMGKYKQARSYYERALAIREKVLGAEHPDTAQTLNNQGVLMKALGEYEQAPLYYERALAIREKVLGAEHPDTALSLNNLGTLWQELGEYEQARPYYERALTIWEKVLGAKHPLTAISLNNLGALMKALGEYESACPYHERALAIREKVLGVEHPSTAMSLNNLGYLLDAQGEYERARPYHERALAIKEKVLGAEHPLTALSLNNVGMFLQAMGKYEQARPYHERALAIREKVLGAEHPSTAQSLNNLGALWKAQGEYENAHPYFERAQAIFDKVLGAEHPDTAQSLKNLGLLWQAMGEYEQARPVYERALAIFEKRLGKEHPHTRIVRGNLAALPSPKSA